MKKLCLASIILTVSISLVGCTNPGAAGKGNQNSIEPSTQNSNESKVQNSNESSKQNNNVNNAGEISLEKAKEIALSHAGLTSSQVSFKRTELDFDNGIKEYDVEFYYNNLEYSYEIDANSGKILSYEHD